MVWTAQRPAFRRRVVLVLDCLEDRFAPATIALLGQTASDLVSISTRIDLDASAAGRFAVAAPVYSAVESSARFDDVPFGFFHPFCQNGFGGCESMMDEAPLPQPRPVVPPLDPAQFLQEPDLFDAPRLAAPPVSNESPAPALEAPPVVLRTPIAEPMVAPRASSPAERTVEPAPGNDFADHTASVMLASHGSRGGLAAIGGLMAAFGLLYTRNVRERRYENDIIFGQ